MKILIIADIHGYSEKISNFFDRLAVNDIDLIICPGDFTDMFNTPPGFTQEDVAEMIIQKLLSFNKPLFCVPGNLDPYEILMIFDEYGVNLHNKVKTFRNLSFAGWGGAETPFRTNIEPTEEETREALSNMEKQIKNDFVLVLHNPPKNTKLDKIKSGQHVGSLEARRFIERKQPLLVISAHIHERHGVDYIGKSMIFYPGPFFEGNYGIVRIEKNKIEWEILNAKKQLF